MGIIIAILLFSFIIIFHELGHFLLAKANGIRVDEFSLGLGPTLFGRKIGGTFFCVKLLPFGGACMMGEDDADDMSEGSFNSKSVWARISVIAAGPLFNLLLAWILWERQAICPPRSVLYPTVIPPRNRAYRPET